MEKSVTLSVETENLAVPEVHTGKVPEEAEEAEKPKAKKHHWNIQYEVVAIPEVHTGHNK